MRSLQGVIVPTLTFFSADGSLDLHACAEHFRMLEAAGVDGFLILGSTGEFFHMTAEERMSYTEWAIAQVGGRLPVLVGTGDLSTAGAISLTRHARDVGADGAVIISPFYWPPSQNQLYHYFADIAEAVDIPIILYNFPAMTGTSLTPELVLSLARDHPNIVGIKQTVATPDPLRDVAQLVLPHRPDFRIFIGGDDLALYNLIMGGAGSIATSWNFAPEAAVALDRAFRAGDFEAASREQRRLSIISAVYTLDPCLASVAKEALFILGKGPEPVLRGPAQRLDEPARAKLRQILADAGLLNT